MKSRRTHKQEALAKLYDAEILPIWAQRFGRMLLRDLTLPPKAMVLDVGCGTGYPALDVLRKMDDQGRIIAIDAAQSMLSIAREKAGALSGKRIYFRSEATEPRLSFADDVYDLVVSNLWLTEVDDPAALVSEFARVAKPGGRVIATTPLRGTFGEFYDIYREVLIKRDRTEALARLDHWTAHYPTPAHAEALFQRAGLTEVTVERETFTLLFKSSREFFFAPVIEYGPLSMWKEIAGKGPEMQEVFRQIKEAIDSYFGGGTFSVTVDAACIRGRKPETDEAARRAGEEVTRPGGAAQGEPPTDKKIRLPEGIDTAVDGTGEIAIHASEIDIIESRDRSLLDREEDEEDPI